MSTHAEHAYRSLRDMLLAGEFLPGQKLSQLQLARKLGCSTVPVVEALRRLESDGLVTKTARKIARVRAFTLQELRDLYLLRASLEGVLARLCARRITSREVAHLKKLSRQSVAALRKGDVAVDRKLEVQIHQFIADCARSPLLSDELKKLLLVERTAGRHPAPNVPPGPFGSIHQAVIHAIADHDPDSAEYLMRKHILGGYKDYRSKIKSRKSKS